MSKETEEQPTAEVFETAKQYFEMATANTILTKPEIDSELCLVLMRDYALTKAEEYASIQQSTVTDEEIEKAFKKYNSQGDPPGIKHHAYSFEDFKAGMIAMRDHTPSTKEVTDEEIENQFPSISIHSKNYCKQQGAKWLRSQQKAGSEENVYTQKECIFKYCPSPELCKSENKCQNLK